MDPLFLGLRHVALSVRDVRRSLAFYSNVLGMKLEWMPDEDNAYLTSGHDNLALHKVADGAEFGGAQWLHHIGFMVRHPENVDEWAERLKAQGIALAQDPRTHRDGARSIYFHDPDGILIQLIYHPPISEMGTQNV
jgi:catechol 2,3-dioxygenase-like lactoylglutathione lyase family enzyme